MNNDDTTEIDTMYFYTRINPEHPMGQRVLRINSVDGEVVEIPVLVEGQP